MNPLKVEFSQEKLQQIDTIKNGIARNFKELGFENRPEDVNDQMALEFALAFASEFITIKNLESKNNVVNLFQK